MRKFQVLRYIKRLRYLIVAITLLGSLFINWYAQSNQRYTAEVVIQYTNSGAKYGNAPDGSPIDAKDVYSAAVITDVIEELKLGVNIDKIRTACSVKEIISEDDEKRKEALLDEGLEFNEITTTYLVSFSTDSSGSKEYVSDVLNSIMNNYYIFYSMKYIDSTAIPNNSLNITADKYDYLECVEILDKSIQEIDTYLNSKAVNYPSFRSSRTGYTFSDLRNEYNYISENNISQYYALVIGNKLTVNKDELICTYQNRLDRDMIDIANYSDHIEKQRSLIDQFGDKVTYSNTLVGGAVGDNTDAIIKDVEDYYHNRIDEETEYDNLIDNYVKLQSDRNSTETDMDYCMDILKVFGSDDVINSVDTELTKEFISEMEETIAKLNDLYEILVETSKEQCEHSAAKNITALSGVYAQEEINVNLYRLLAVVLFFVIGVAGAIVIGRGIDIWEYIVYVDKKTGLANRTRCDLVIDEYAKKPLDENFGCIVFRLNNLGTLNIKNGHNAGDTLLMQYSKFLNENLSDQGFVGYNGGNTFIVLLENCSKGRAEGLVARLEEKIKEKGFEEKFDFSYGISDSTDDKEYEIRHIIQKAIERLYDKKIPLRDKEDSIFDYD